MHRNRNKYVYAVLSFFFIIGIVSVALMPDKQEKKGNPWLSTQEADIPEANEIHEIIQNFQPVVIGDPITAAEYRYFSKWCCLIWPIFTAIVCSLATAILTKHKWQEIPFKQKRSIVILYIVCPSIVTCISGYASSYYFGGPYNYKNYTVPMEPSDIVVWFSGADDGAYFKDNYARSAREFGQDRAALFNFRDISKALKFAEKLPQGCRIIVRGHSMGAASAFRFAKKCNREILILDTRDPTSWFGKPKSKPSNVIHWRNIIPYDTHPCARECHHEDTYYFAIFNMANIFRWLGRPWDSCNGAVNIYLFGFDHHDVGENID